MGYLGKSMQDITQSFGRTLEIVKRPRKWFRVPNEIKDINSYLQESGINTSDGFKVLPRRWVVERTFAWINRYRGLSKDYEYCCYTSKTFLFVAMTRTMLKRLKKTHH